MNWIKKILGQKEASSPEIGFEELPAWLEARSEKIYGSISKHAASLYPDIENALSKIKKSTASLEEADPEGRFHLRMVKIGSSNRDNMVKQVKMLIENMKGCPETTDMRTVREFHENAMHSLTVCLENMMKSHQYTKTVFLEESKQLVADVNTLRRILDQLIEPINEQKNMIEAFENSESTIENIKNTFDDIEIERKRITENEENILSLKKDIQEKQEALALLKESDNWKQYLDLRDELARLEDMTEKTESEINALVLPLNKGLNRLRQLSESGRYTLNPQLKEGLYACLTDRKCANADFFMEFQKIVESDTLNLSPDKQDKMVEQIKLVISSIDTRKKDHQSLMNDIEKKKSEISGMNIHHEKENITDAIKELQYQLETSEKELESSNNHLASLEQRLVSSKQELQETISAIDPGKRVSF